MQIESYPEKEREGGAATSERMRRDAAAVRSRGDGNGVNAMIFHRLSGSEFGGLLKISFEISHLS